MNKVKYILFTISSMLLGINFVNAQECAYCGNGALGIPSAIPKFVSGSITLLQVLIPVILIVVGMVQFLKAMASGEDKVQKDAIASFIRSVVAGIAIFLVVVVVKFVFINFLGKDGESSFNCVSCFFDSDTCVVASCPVRPQVCSELSGGSCSSTPGCKLAADGTCKYDSGYNPVTNSSGTSACSVLGAKECAARSDCEWKATSNNGTPSCYDKSNSTNSSGTSACSVLGAKECAARSDCEWKATSNSGSPSCHSK